jgi:hypothetical protein
VTLRRIARLCLIYLALCLSGLAASELAASPSQQVFGLGFMLPGGGFLAYADLASLQGLLWLGAAVLAMAAFGAALVLWFATGNVIAPAVVWLLAAVAAALPDDGAVHREAACEVTVALVAALIVAIFGAIFRRRWGQAQRRSANAYLVQTSRNGIESLPAPAGEFSCRELKLMRFLLDRALQPLAGYEGFEWLDQFQTAALRYQLNFIGYALSMAQATRLPALGAYLDDAQRNLIDKQTDHRIWRYWALENFWGNLDPDPDPCGRDNIMFTGFCAMQIAMYHAASGRRDYDRPGSFQLRHPSGRTWRHDLESLVGVLGREQSRSAFHLVACEPNWIYPLCNTIGAAGMRAHDHLSGATRWSRNANRFRRNLEDEFIDLAGRFVPCRSAYAGLALPVLGGAQPQSLPCFFLNATLPDIAQRQWLLLRRNLLTENDTLDPRKFWPVDTGNYRFSRAAAYASAALTAAELGDRKVAALCLDALDRECPPATDAEAFYRPRASVWAHATEFFARSAVENGFRSLVERPRRTRPAPRITACAYPDVLVARAVSERGGLAAVLYPGAGGGRHRLGISGLRPGTSYRAQGIDSPVVVADRAGSVTIEVTLAGRTQISLRPFV